MSTSLLLSAKSNEQMTGDILFCLHHGTPDTPKYRTFEFHMQPLPLSINSMDFTLQ
jgi:hypothetical protein